MTSERLNTTMAVVHRPCSSGIDLPAGASARDVAPDDYRAVEMPEPGVEPAAVHRPGDMGIDLPAGKSAAALVPTDYRVVEVE